MAIVDFATLCAEKRRRKKKKKKKKKKEEKKNGVSILPSQLRFGSNKLINSKQHGFMKGRSTSLQLLHLLYKWTDSLERGGQIDTIYTDFEKRPSITGFDL
jgi:hypothetical protein